MENDGVFAGSNDTRDDMTRAFCGENEVFLDPSITNRSQLVISFCFQDTVLVWIPCLILWLLTPLYILLLRLEIGLEVQQCQRSQRGLLNIIKLVVGALLSLLSVAEIILVAIKAPYPHGDFISAMLGSCIRLVTMVIVTILMAWEFRKAVYSSGFLFVFWLVYAICYSVMIYSYTTLHEISDFYRLYCEVRMASYSLVLLQLILSLLRDGTILRITGLDGGQSDLQQQQEAVEYQNDERTPLMHRQTERKNSPVRSSSFLSKLFFAWAAPIMYRGYKSCIKYVDIPDVWPTELSRRLLPRFEAILANDRSDREHSRKYFFGLLKSVAFLTVKGGLLRLLTILFLFLNLLIFRNLIAFIRAENPNVWVGYIFAAGLFLLTLIRGLIVVRWLYDNDLVGMHLRSLITATVYRKILRLSNSCVVENMDIGFVVNLMSVDSLRLSMSCRSLHEIVTMPIYLALATYFFFDTIHWPALIGMLVMITVVPLVTTIVTIKNKQLQDRQMDAKDQRLKVMSEILTGIKVIKLYAWELVFEKRVTEIRREELRNIRFSACLNAIGNITCLITPFIVSLVMFGSFIALPDYYTGASTILDAESAFLTLSLICLLNYNVSTLPSSVQYVIQGFIALKRAACLMDQDEVQTNDNHLLPVFGGPAVEIEDGNFNWVGPDKPTLKDINLKIAPGKLVAVIGGVGSGKSSLLSSLLREMKSTTAKVTISDNVAYLPQQAWILNGTVRDNIRFHKPYNETRFKKIAEACALVPDLQNLPGGELEEIGSKGANLSGGQKQRVSIARAVYSYSDTYLIDDSLSAVDPNVGQHIFQKVFGPRGIIRKKVAASIVCHIASLLLAFVHLSDEVNPNSPVILVCASGGRVAPGVDTQHQTIETRIFATNSYGYLPEVDRILVMKDGRIVEDGTYDDLNRSGTEFARLISRPPSSEATEEESTAPAKVEKSVSRRVSALDVLGRAISRTLSYEAGGVSSDPRPTGINPSMEFSLSTDFLLTSSEGESDGAQGQPGGHTITTAESLGTGSTKWHVVWTYIKSGGLGVFIALILSHLVFIASCAAANVWLKIWCDSKDAALQKHYLLIYGIFGIVQLLAITTIYCLFACGFLRASRNLHSTVLFRLFRAPLSFFDTNPPGRVLNVFSTDMDTVDASLPLDIILWLISVSFLLGAVVTIGVAKPIFLCIIVPLILINVFAQKVYGASAIPLKRFYAVKKSPIYSHFEETIVGAASIRAYRQQQNFIDKCDQLTDESHRPWCTYVACWRLFTCYNEIIGTLAVFLTAAVAVALNEDKSQSLTSGAIGLALFSVFQVLPHIPIASRMTVEIEANIVAVARINEYSNEPCVPMEAAWDVPEAEPRPAWPEQGVVQFERFSISYREGLELVLSDLSFKINAREKIGIVGRTGAGKSSIILSLFRMMEAAEGRIIIDGEEIGRMGLHDLRSRLTTIPQDPILFTGTLRSNLDPKKMYDDDQIWRSLEQAYLKKYVEANMPRGLDEIVSSGDEISVGQRQLLCMARALLRNSRIIVLDEATSGIDPLSDKLIQKTIREQFTKSTVITIAHRIATIMDYDRVMVLDHGKLLEMDSPRNLVSKPDSVFAAMAKETNKTFGDNTQTGGGSAKDGARGMPSDIDEI